MKKKTFRYRKTIEAENEEELYFVMKIPEYFFFIHKIYEKNEDPMQDLIDGKVLRSKTDYSNRKDYVEDNRYIYKSVFKSTERVIGPSKTEMKIPYVNRNGTYKMYKVIEETDEVKK